MSTNMCTISILITSLGPNMWCRWWQQFQPRQTCQHQAQIRLTLRLTLLACCSLGFGLLWHHIIALLFYFDWSSTRLSSQLALLCLCVGGTRQMVGSLYYRTDIINFLYIIFKCNEDAANAPAKGCIVITNDSSNFETSFCDRLINRMAVSL